MKHGLVIPFVVVTFWLCLSMIRIGQVTDEIGQLKSDRATVQQQIAAEQARTRRLEAAIQQILNDRAQTSASVTSTSCTLHDIYIQSPGC